MKEKKHRYCLPPCAVFDVERIESWLTDMAAQGWHLKDISVSLKLFRFTQGTAQHVRYRLEPKGKFEDDSQKPEMSIRKMYEDFGWEAVAGLRQFYIFRTADPTVRELHTDPAMHAQVYKRVLWQCFWWDMVWLLIPVIVIFLPRNEYYRSIAVKGAVWMVYHPAILSVLFLVPAVWKFFCFLRIYRRLKAHQPLHQGKDWQKGALWHKLAAVLEKTVIVMLFLSLTLQFCWIAFTHRPLEEYPGDPPIVTIADLLPEGDYTPLTWLDLNDYDRNATLLSKENLSWSENARVTMPDGSVVSALLIVNYHETAAHWLAMGLAREYLREGEDRKGCTPIELLPLDVDFAAAYSDHGSPKVILCKGNKVVEATLSFGDHQAEMLDLWIEKMVEKMNG